MKKILLLTRTLRRRLLQVTWRPFHQNYKSRKDKTLSTFTDRFNYEGGLIIGKFYAPRVKNRSVFLLASINKHLGQVASHLWLLWIEVEEA
jgi:hypothetical protein